MPDAAALLELVHVSRTLGGRAVLSGVSFTLARGEVLGLLGPNGAGKSTTLAIIAGVLRADSGSVRWHGAKLGSAARHAGIGWVPERVSLWPELTVNEALDACGRLQGLARAARNIACERELARLHLEPLARRLCGRLSLGQQRRLGLAQALLHEPALLVLDEPGNGLDPQQALSLRELIATLAPTRGIILSSHDLPEVEATCHRALILHHGRVCAGGSIDVRAGQLAARFHALTADPAQAAA